MTAAFPIATRVLREQTNPADSVASTARTVAWMGELSRNAARDPIIQSIAAEIRRRAAGGSVRDLCAGVWEFVKRRVRFVHDDTAIKRLFNESGQLELLIHPVVLLSMPVPAGDCDDFTMLGCALLLALGVEPTIVCLCCDSAAPGRFSHVYLEVSAGGRRWPVDASHGRYFGWEVPDVDVYRRQGWDCNGRKLFDVSRMGAVSGVAGRGLGDAVLLNPLDDATLTVNQRFGLAVDRFWDNALGGDSVDSATLHRRNETVAYAGLALALLIVWKFDGWQKVAAWPVMALTPRLFRGGF